MSRGSTVTQEGGKEVPAPPGPSAGPPEAKKRDLPTFSDLGPNAMPFEKYLQMHIAYIREVQEMVQTPLEDNLAAMDAQVREVEAAGSRMASILSWADSYLDVAEHLALRNMPPRDPRDWTDLDREKALAAAVTRERRFRDVLRGLCKSIEKRVSYAQSRMRAFSQAEGQRFQP